MSKIKLSDSDKRLLVIFLAIVLVAASYFFVFNKGMAKAAAVEEENDKDRATVQQMEQMEANLPVVEQNMEELKQKQADIIAKYPSDLTTEKVISILQSIEDNNDYHISEVSFTMLTPMVVETAAADTASTETTSAETDSTETADTSADTADTETDATADTQSSTEGAVDDAQAQSGAASQVRGYFATITIKYDASYAGLKQMISYVNEYADRMTITESSASFDSETGRLTGDMTLNMYYLTNTGKEYEAPDFEGISKGVSNIFGGSAGTPGASNEE